MIKNIILTTRLQQRYYQSDILGFGWWDIHLLDDVWGRNVIWNFMTIVSNHTVIHTRFVKYIATQSLSHEFVSTM